MTVPCQSFDLLAGPSPSGKISFERKKNTAFRRWPRALIRTLAGFFARDVDVALAAPGPPVGHFAAAGSNVAKERETALPESAIS